MRVAVNSELCQGHNRCYALAPELFDVDEYGNAVVLGDGRCRPSSRTRRGSAFGNCPEYAISIVEGRNERDRHPRRARRTGRPISTTPTRRTTPTRTRSGTELRDGGCPVAHTPRYGGMWAPLTHELVHEVAYDTEHFTSNGVDRQQRASRHRRAPVGPAPPITSDPPFHQIARRLLLPPFSPKAIDPWEPDVRRLCDELLDRIGAVTPGESVVDAAVAVRAEHPGQRDRPHARFPARGRGGVPRLRAQRDRTGRPAAPEQRIANFQQLDEYIDVQIADHIANPRDDLTSYLLDAELDGHRLAYEHVRGSIVLLLIAGIDTTWSAIGASLWHLASNPDDLQRLVDDPGVSMFAVEEFLRAYAPVTMARLVKDDYDFHGCPMKSYSNTN